MTSWFVTDYIDHIEGPEHHPEPIPPPPPVGFTMENAGFGIPIDDIVAVDQLSIRPGYNAQLGTPPPPADRDSSIEYLTPEQIAAPTVYDASPRMYRNTIATEPEPMARPSGRIHHLSYTYSSLPARVFLNGRRIDNNDDDE